MTMGMFQVGDKVRVVKPAYFNEAVQLVDGKVYTVTEVNEHTINDREGVYGINVNNGDGGYGAWDSDRFELVTEDEELVPAGVQKAHEQAGELFSLLAESAILAIIEQRPDQVKFIKHVSEHIDAFMLSLEEEYPTLDKEDV